MVTIKRCVCLLTGLLFGLTACVHDPILVPPHPPGLPHPAHYYDYHYYPSVGVYFHIADGFYYYNNGTAWVRVRVLPPKFRIRARDRVRLKIPSDRPYEKHREHRERYRPKRHERPDKADKESWKKEREENMRHHRRYKNRKK